MTRRKSTSLWGPEEAVRGAACVVKAADDLTAVVHAIGLGDGCAGELNSGENTVLLDETAGSAGKRVIRASEGGFGEVYALDQRVGGVAQNEAVKDAILNLEVE